MFHILVVDDNPLDVRLFETLLSAVHRPYRMEWAKDGSAALKVLESRKTHGPLPDLILMDVHMPNVNGLQALQAVKGDPELSVIPVIMLSTVAEPGLVCKIYQAHANCFVQKPTSAERAYGFVRAVEAFWMDFAVLPSRHSTNDLTAADKGPPVAPATWEARSHSMNSAGSKRTVSPDQLLCDEHRRLMDEFTASVKELLDLHQQQFDAAVHGDPESARFDLLIHMANEKKQQAKYACLRHVESHGCSNLDATTNAARTRSHQ